jgi:hypothetical protein
MTLDLNLSSVPTVGGAAFSSDTYGSAAAWEAALVALSFTDSANETYTLGDISSVTAPSPMVWSDTGVLTPQYGPAGNYLVPSFILANPAETLSFNTGATDPPSVGLSTNSVSAPNAYDVGYWELASATPTPVPLPGTLPLLLGGVGLVGALAWRGRRHTGLGAVL